MPNFLLIESSSRNCSVAVCTEDSILSIREEASDQFVHSEKLHVFIKECIQESGLEYSDLDAVAVSKGPGSYSGLRIGVSAAKGICYPLEIPLIAIDSLTILASQLFNQVSGVIVPIMDARRMEVYEAVFTEKGKQQAPIAAKIVDESSYSNILEKGKVHFDFGKPLNEELEILDTAKNSKQQLEFLTKRIVLPSMLFMDLFVLRMK